MSEPVCVSVCGHERVSVCGGLRLRLKRERDRESQREREREKGFLTSAKLHSKEIDRC